MVLRLLRMQKLKKCDHGCCRLRYYNLAHSISQYRKLPANKF